MVLFILVATVPLLTQELWFCKLCPAGTLEAGIPLVLTDAGLRAQIGNFFVLKLSILVAFIGAMMLIKRPFCRFACPLGAIYAPFNRHSVLHLEVDQDVCIKCDKCWDVCPVDIKIYEDANSPECIRCFECARVCPVSAIGHRRSELANEALEHS